VFTFEEPVDPGLVEWASSYLNEQLAGLALGARMIADRLADPELGAAERAFIGEIEDAFTGLEERAEADLYVEGAAPGDMLEVRVLDLPHVDALMRALERRAGLLGILRSALEGALRVPVDRG
jgi:heat-inducible transcriptional repressor